MQDTKILKKSPGISSYFHLQKRIFNSTTWIGKSGLRLLWPKERILNDQKLFLTSRKSIEILNAIKNQDIITYELASHDEIFNVIFNDRDFQRKESKYKSKLEIPQVNTSLVLVSGVLNEVFTTAAFERGAKFLHEEYGITYRICKTSGVKSVKENSRLIKEQIEQTYDDTQEPVWVLAFSKGGLDFLHFMKDYPELAKKYIGGFSTVASPILGSNRINHKIITLVNSLHKLAHLKVYQKLDAKFDLLLKEFQKSISVEFQEGWFKENFHYLPKDIFYSALALQTNWYDSHVWMILTKLFFQSNKPNDGIVDTDSALYPSYFKGINLGILKGHHLVGTRSSDYSQEALLEAHLIFRDYYENVLKPTT